MSNYNQHKLLPLLAAFMLLYACQGNEKNPAATTKFKGVTLNILCWEGYADAQFTKDFQDKYGCTVKGTYFGSQAEMIATLQSEAGSGAYDIVSPSCDFANYLIQTDLVEPLDTSKISQWNMLSPQLRSLTDVRKDGKVYGLPLTWGPDYLIYNADVIKEAPTSWRILWDRKYKGQVSIPGDIVNIYTTGLLLGMAKTDPSALYNMTPQQLLQCKTELIKLQPNIRKYWTDADELDNMFRNKEVTLALGWPMTLNALQKAGFNVKAVIPEEGATGWVDQLMVVKGSKNIELGQLWLDYISQPEIMAKVAATTTYAVAHPGAVAHMSEALKKSTDAGNEKYYLDRLNWWQWVKDRAVYDEVIRAVKADQ